MADFDPTNRIYLVGNLAFDPERRGKITTLRLPVRSWRKKKPEDMKEGDRDDHIVNWFRVVCFSAHAETAMQFTKGSRVRIQGSMESYKYVDKAGVEREGLEVHVGGKDAFIEAAPWGQPAPQRQGSQAPSAPPQSASLPLPPNDADVDPNWDDSVPF